jgi:hypothetical protein
MLCIARTVWSCWFRAEVVFVSFVALKTSGSYGSDYEVWDIAPCNLVQVDKLFSSAYRLHHQDDGSLIAVIMEAVSTPETLVIF